MAAPAKADQFDTALATRFPAVGFIPAQDGGQLLTGERLLRPNFVQPGYQNPGAIRHTDAGERGQILRRLPDRAGDDRAVGLEQRPAQGVRLGFVNKISALVHHQLRQPVRDGTVSHYGLFGGADDRVVEGLAGHNIFGGFFNIGAAIHIDRDIARPNAVRRFTHRVRDAHHVAPARCQDHCRALVRHQLLGAWQSDLGQAVDQSLWRPGALGGGGHQTGCLQTAFDRRRVGRDHDRVAGFDRDQNFIYDRGGRVGAGDQRRHHAHRPGDLIHFSVRVVLDDSHRLNIPDALPNVFGGELILELLVFRDAITGLFGSHAAQAFRGQKSRVRHGGADPVHLRLRGFGPDLLRLISPQGQLPGFLDGEKVFVTDSHSVFL